MIPRIFVSSTIKDLQHVRDAIRELIEELGYDPAMSEHGEIGYLPTMSAADACYRETKDCDFGILIIGKRYGDDHRDNISVTHYEYRTLATSVPVITLLEKDLLSYRAVFKANPNSRPATFPGMDHPEKTFGFVDEIMNRPRNNGISEFKHIGEARSYVRQQLAHIFGELLRNAYDPVKGEVRDILAEVRSLRNELIKGQQHLEALKFLKVSRALLEDAQRHFREFLEHMFGNADQPVKAILTHDRLDSLLSDASWQVTEFPTVMDLQRETDKLEKTGGMQFASRWSGVMNDPKQAGGRWFGSFAILTNHRIYLTKDTFEYFRHCHLRCRVAADSQ